MYLYSILIPVYNTEDYLAECLDSVLQQGYQNFEVILINDGSSDSSGDICDSYANRDKRIRLFHQENQGLIITRRNAIAKANGDFCLFLDSDDYWDSNLLEVINKTIIEYDCDMVLYKSRKVSEEGIYISESAAVYEDKTIFDSRNREQLFKKVISGTKLNNLWSKAVKREVIDDMDYYQFRKLKIAEDLLQSLPLLYNAEKIVYLDKALYNYRIRRSSITHTFKVNLYKDVTIVRGIVLQYIKRMSMDDEENLQLFYQFYMVCILNYFSKLLNSDLEKNIKLNILLEIKNIPLYLKALKYNNFSDLSLKQKFQFYIFNKNHYRLLFIFEKLIAVLKIIRDDLFDKKGM